MDSRTPTVVALIVATLVLSDRTIADTMTDRSELSAFARTLDFEGEMVATLPSPFLINDLTFSSDLGWSITDLSKTLGPDADACGLLLHPKSNPIPGGVYLPSRVDFDVPVSEVGFAWWDPNCCGNVLQAYDGEGTLLEEAHPTKHPPGGAAAPFLGIQRTEQDISYVLIVNAGRNDFYAIDHFSYGPSAFTGDIDRNDVININDLIMLLAAWGPCDPPGCEVCRADLNRDERVGVEDLLLLLTNWS